MISVMLYVLYAENSTKLQVLKTFSKLTSNFSISYHFPMSSERSIAGKAGAFGHINRNRHWHTEINAKKYENSGIVALITEWFK